MSAADRIPPPTRAPSHRSTRAWAWALSWALALALLGAFVLEPRPAAAHGGALDEYGGHFDERTGEYHYHKPARDMAARKRDWLTWIRLPVQGEIKGTVDSVENADTFWLYVPYRPAYQELVQSVLPVNRDDRKQLVRVQLSHVSPEETGSRNAKFSEWFIEKVTFELRRKIAGRKVLVKFRVTGGNPGWLKGIVLAGEDGEVNVNLWMVLQGWSYYLVAGGETEYDPLFRKAEDTARENKAGIWQYTR